MVAAAPVLLADAVEMLKQRSSQTTVLVDEGDLTRLLPKLRLGELDLFVGRLEPTYAAPDLETEPLYNEPMQVVVPACHPLARQSRPGWADLAEMSLVMPPPWASLRVKLEKIFHANGLQPSNDLVETASFLGILTFMQQRKAAGFMARSVALHFERMGLVQVLALRVPVELPPVGIMTARSVSMTPSTQMLVECLRAAAASRL